MSCHSPNNKSRNVKNFKDTINIALAGNPNVGKSVIFNQLTGLSQTIGNWPGKTVERMEGYLEFLGYHFNIVDLPGIYSLSTFSLEEIVSREYIISEDVDIIINVIDATNLERNLFFTFQLLELKVPMILAINQMDLLRKRNIDLDFEELERIFKLPVLPMVAIHGTGVHQLLEEAIELVVYRHPHHHYKRRKSVESKHHSHHYYRVEHIQEKSESKERIKRSFKFPDLDQVTSFGKEVELKILSLIEKLNSYRQILSSSNYPSRFLAIKLLENDSEVINFFTDNEEGNSIITSSNKYREELENLHGEDIHTIISSEIYSNIKKIIDLVLITKLKKDIKKRTFTDFVDHLTTHSIFGYVVLIAVLFGIYFFTFSLGDFIAGLIDDVFIVWSDHIYASFSENNIWVKILWDGGVGGLLGAVGGVLVYVIPFFFAIEILQDSGYLPRAAFLMDKIMHSLGVHGKTIIPMILKFGCNVAACAGCRIMETEREKKISVALTSLVPCAATMTVVLGLVGRYLGFYWILILFLINFSVIFIVGRILNKTLPGQCTELIMEMHEYRLPNYVVIFKQTWVRSKEFIFKAMPIMVIFGIILEILLIFNALEPVNVILSPVTVLWLGLPAITGVFLIYGILRKELTLVLLSILANSLNVSLLELLTPIQMVVFSLVTMLYVPCFATIIILAKQTSWKFAIQISLLEIFLALLIGGIINFGFLIFISL
ncbi:MAG TPA: ferrous iron transport protein B [Candidatus Nanopelagicaceae bacterium]|nr:ferrous iron transport protein B [Candidatus Nanopelagicaceae bacterium]